MAENKEKNIIDLSLIGKTLWAKRKLYYITLPIVFVLSCIWIFPEPRFYNCSVELAPENGGSSLGGLAGLASSVGLNIGDAETSDAIYPTLYPELFSSPEFIVGLFDIKVTTDDGSLTTDYYTYLKKHQKKNWLTAPFKKWKYAIAQKLSGEPQETAKSGNNTKGGKFNSFKMSKKDFGLVTMIQKNISCNVDKKTDVITITVKDQDRQICALLADSIRSRLQAFIIDYRTKKARQDVKYFQHLADSTKIEYDKAVTAYGIYNDSHRNVVLQTYVEEGDRLKNDMDLKLQTYNTFAAQLSAAKAKVQERTPSFTTLVSATVPQKPAGPKRMIFVIGCLVLSFFALSIFYLRNIFFRQ